MKFKQITIILLLTIPLFLCSCGSLIKQPAPIISYYQLNYTPEITNTASVDKTLLIRSFYINETYNRDTIMYSEDKYKCGFYPYKQWISAPQNQVTEAIRNDFIESGAFKAIIIPGQLQKFDLILTGAIIDIKEVRKDGKSIGTVKMAITLIKPASKNISQEILLQKEYTKSIECKVNNTESLVKALSEATKAISSEVIKDTIKAAKP